MIGVSHDLFQNLSRVFVFIVPAIESVHMFHML